MKRLVYVGRGFVVEIPVEPGREEYAKRLLERLERLAEEAKRLAGAGERGEREAEPA